MKKRRGILVGLALCIAGFICLFEQTLTLREEPLAANKSLYVQTQNYCSNTLGGIPTSRPAYSWGHPSTKLANQVIDEMVAAKDLSEKEKLAVELKSVVMFGQRTGPEDAEQIEARVRSRWK